MTFKISEHVEFDDKGRAPCPCCVTNGKPKGKTLSLVPDTDGAYKCFRGCTPQEIRAAIGQVGDKVVPTAIARKTRGTTVTPQKLKEQTLFLLKHPQAKGWLNNRGITDEMIDHYRLGLCHVVVDGRSRQAITINFPADPDGTTYYQKKRVLPWVPDEELPEDCPKWKQYGIPARVWFTHRPDKPDLTILCEGEWDAIVTGWAIRQAGKNVAVATFTAGAGNIPSDAVDMPGDIVVFYDLDEPGRKGAEKVAKTIGARCRIGQVPTLTNEIQQGRDLSDFFGGGGTLDALAIAVDRSVECEKPQAANLKDRLCSTDELIAKTQDYQDWLLPDLLTSDEMFILGAPPRGGKSLLALLLAKAIATGSKFLDRPTNQGSVLYVNLEDSNVKVKERVEAQGWPPGTPVWWLDKFKLSQIDELIAIARSIPDLRLIILDTLSRIRDDQHSESAAEMSYVLEPLQEFCKKEKVAALLVHHTRKLQQNEEGIESLFDSLRGSTAIRGTARGLWILANGSDCQRLAVETGWGKHDLKLRLNSTTLEWQLLGKWNPVINLDQKELVLNLLNRIGSGTIDQIALETGIPKRSLYTVLDRLRGDGLVEKTGSRQAAVYIRPIQQIQQLNSLLNPPIPDTPGNTDAIQQKNKIFPSFVELQSTDVTDTVPVEREKFISPSQTPYLHSVTTGSNACGEGDRGGSEERILKNSTPKVDTFVELEGSEGSNLDGDGVSQFNSNSTTNSTVELVGRLVYVKTRRGDRPGVFKKVLDRSYMSLTTGKLDTACVISCRGGPVTAAMSDVTFCD